MVWFKDVVAQLGTTNLVVSRAHVLIRVLDKYGKSIYTVVMVQYHVSQSCSAILANQVQQRGIPATRDILLKLLDGMNEQSGQKVLVVDLIPSR